MARLISSVIFIPIAIVAVLFALSNRSLIAIDILGSGLIVDVAVYIAVFVPFVLGFLMGGVFVYAGQYKHRRKARRLEKEIKSQTKELERLQALNNQNSTEKQALIEDSSKARPSLRLIEGDSKH